MYCPLSKVKALLETVQQSIPLSTPIWLCPVRSAQSLGPAQLLSPHTSAIPVGSEDMLVDVGIYGRVPDNRAGHYTRLLDRWGLDNMAKKMVPPPPPPPLFTVLTVLHATM
jgi:hypothetical protein